MLAMMAARGALYRRAPLELGLRASSTLSAHASGGLARASARQRRRGGSYHIPTLTYARSSSRPSTWACSRLRTSVWLKRLAWLEFQSPRVENFRLGRLHGALHVVSPERRTSPGDGGSSLRRWHGAVGQADSPPPCLLGRQATGDRRQAQDLMRFSTMEPCVSGSTLPPVP